VELADPQSMARGLWLEDAATERKIEIRIVDLNKGTAGGKICRRIRIFTPYVFLDRTNLQLKLSEDTVAWVNSHPQPNNGELITTKMMFSAHYKELDRQFIYLASAGNTSWTPPINFASALLPMEEDTTDADGTATASVNPALKVATAVTTLAGGKEAEGQSVAEPQIVSMQHSKDGARFCIVRVPVRMAFAPTAVDLPPVEDETLRHVHTEVVVSLLPNALKSQVSPVKFALTPRLCIINQLGCALGVRRFNVLPYRGSGERDYELPMFVAAGTASPFLFWDSRSNDSLTEALDIAAYHSCQYLLQPPRRSGLKCGSGARRSCCTVALTV